MTIRHRSASVGAAALVAILQNAPATAGPAIGQFEIKSLQSTPGEIEFQSQNAYALGTPRRETRTVGSDFEADPNSLPRQRHALELEFGITKFLKTRIGIEYENERREDPATDAAAQGFEDLKLDEYAAEAILVMVPRNGDGFGLGVVIEYEHPAESGGARTLNYGPLIEWGSGPWTLSLHPMLIQFFGGERNAAGQKDEKIDFGYAARLMNQWSENFAVALEAYGTVERVAGRGGKSDDALLFGNYDQHRLGPVLYWSWEADRNPFGRDQESEVTLGFGTLFGLNDETPDATLKLSMEVTF